MTEKILDTLLESNKRFYSGKSKHPNSDQTTRNKLLARQTPLAVVISCSDSRAPVELLFDVGIGDLFVIRSAGHILTESEMASIEYAIEHLGTKLIIVMGHSCCGAVTSALNHSKEEHLSSNMSLLIKRIQPAIDKAKRQNISGDKMLDVCIDNNIYETIDYIKQDETLTRLIVKMKVDIVPMKYDIETGEVKQI